MKTLINWKVFFILWIASIFSVIAVLPYSLALQSNVMQNLKLPLPLPAVIVLQILQNAILFALIIFGGMFFASRVGLGTPILDSVTCSESALLTNVTTRRVERIACLLLWRDCRRNPIAFVCDVLPGMARTLCQ